MQKSKAPNYHKLFKPQLTPPQMLRLGVFNGNYLGQSIITEFPQSWQRGALLSRNGYRPEIGCNAFGVQSGQSLAVWKAEGWINPIDPLGWFQWYCRYYMGRRCEDDIRQIKRWLSFVRHSAQMVKNGRGFTEHRLKQRQALLHWAYDPCPDVVTPEGWSVFKKTQALTRNIHVQRTNKGRTNPTPS